MPGGYRDKQRGWHGREVEMDRCIQSQRGERMETHLARRTEVGGSSIACKSVCLYGVFHLRSQADEPLGGGKRWGLPVAANRKGRIDTRADDWIAKQYRHFQGGQPNGVTSLRPEQAFLEAQISRDFFLTFRPRRLAL